MLLKATTNFYPWILTLNFVILQIFLSVLEAISYWFAYTDKLKFIQYNLVLLLETSANCYPFILSTKFCYTLTFLSVLKIIDYSHFHAFFRWETANITSFCLLKLLPNFAFRFWLQTFVILQIFSSVLEIMASWFSCIYQLEISQHNLVLLFGVIAKFDPYISIQEFCQAPNLFIRF